MDNDNIKGCTMDDIPEDLLDDATLEHLVQTLELNVDNIYHFMLINGAEMIGEIFDEPSEIEPDPDFEPDSDLEYDILWEQSADFHRFNERLEEAYDDYLVVNPVKVLNTTHLDENGDIFVRRGFVTWNSCTDDPFAPIKKSAIMSKTKPDPMTLKKYLYAVYELYYPLLEDVTIPETFEEIMAREGVTKTSFTLHLKDQTPSNVIDFKKYHLNRINGGF